MTDVVGPPLVTTEGDGRQKDGSMLCKKGRMSYTGSKFYCGDILNVALQRSTFGVSMDV